MKTRRLLAIYVFFPDALASLQSGLSVRPFLLSKGPEDTNDCLCIQILHLSDVPLGFVYRFAAVNGFGKPGKSAAAAAITLTTQGEMCI